MLQDWRLGGEFESGGIPTLGVEWVERVSLLHVLLKRKPRGYTFYSEDPPEDEAELADKDEPEFFVMD